MKIAVYAIAKNEAHNVKDWYESIKGADGIFVLDTGSTDSTIQDLQALGVTVNERNVNKAFRFDQARNEAMTHIPPEFDVCVSIDFDERFSSNWRKEIEDNYKGGIAAYTLRLFNGNECATSYPRAAIHERKAAYWEYPVHEILNAPYTALLNFTCDHKSEGKPAGHYLSLLRLSVQENQMNSRCLTYLAREFGYIGDLENALFYYEKALNAEKFAPFISDIYRNMAYLYEKKEEWANVEKYYSLAINACYTIREPLFSAAHYYMRTGDYHLAIGYALRALNIQRDPNLPYMWEEHIYKSSCEHLLFTCHDILGFRTVANSWLHAALTKNADNVDTNLIEEAIKRGYVNVTDSSNSQLDGGQV